MPHKRRANENSQAIGGGIPPPFKATSLCAHLPHMVWVDESKFVHIGYKAMLSRWNKERLNKALVESTLWRKRCGTASECVPEQCRAEVHHMFHNFGTTSQLPSDVSM